MNRQGLIYHDGETFWVGVDASQTHTSKRVVISSGDDETGVIISKKTSNGRKEVYLADEEHSHKIFSRIIVGSSTIEADSSTDALTLIAGANVTLTPNTNTDTITVGATDTTYSDASSTSPGLMTAAMFNKLDGIASGAEVNQNAFSNIVVGLTTIASNSKTGTITLVPGSNIILTPDATSRSIAVAADMSGYLPLTGGSLSGTLSVDGKVLVNVNGTGLHGMTKNNAYELNLIGISTLNNVVIGTDDSTDRTKYGNIHLYAGTANDSSIKLDATKTNVIGTLTTGGTVTAGGGLYTNGKTGVSDGVAGAAITTTGTMHLSAADSPFIYFKYANSTSSWTRIGQTTPTSKRSIYLPDSSGTISLSSSDVRLKSNITDSETSGLDLVKKIKMRQFDWIEDGKHQKIGFVADELEELDDHLSVGGGYHNDGTMDVKCVDDFYLLGYVVKALQELLDKVSDLEEEVRQLKERR